MLVHAATSWILPQEFFFLCWPSFHCISCISTWDQHVLPHHDIPIMITCKVLRFFFYKINIYFGESRPSSKEKTFLQNIQTQIKWMGQLKKIFVREDNCYIYLLNLPHTWTESVGPYQDQSVVFWLAFHCHGICHISWNIQAFHQDLE